MKEPKIRFQESEGVWKNVYFSEIAERISVSGQAGTLPGIEFEDIISGEGRLNKDVYQKECFKYGKLFNKGDVLFGKLRPDLKNIILADFRGVAIGDFWVLRSKENNSKFLYTMVLSEAFMKVANISSGSKMPRADWNLVSATRFNIPINKKEQQYIGKYFSIFDTQISTASSRLASLKQVKEASLQAMFPQKGETVPKIRFKGFEEEWVNVRLEDIGYCYTGLSGKTKEDFGAGTSWYISFLNVLTNAKIDTTLFEKVKVNKDEHQNEVHKGDLFFNTSSETPEEVGMCSVLDVETKNVYLNSFCFGFRITDNNINPLYIAYLIRSNIGRRIMSVLAQGATRFNLSKSNFYKIEIWVPSCIEEQQKIASYFTSLDKQIALQTQRLEKLRQIKAACLDKMFV